MSIPRIYLTGSVTLEQAGRLVAEGDFPGRQGRAAFVFLAAHRHQPISRSDFEAAIWPVRPPPEADAALSALVSKLRAVLRRVGWTPADSSIEVRARAIELKLPPRAWVDVEAASNAVDEAEGALRAGDPAKAWGHANVAVAIARRPFLPDHEAPWIEARRALLRTLCVRGLQSLAAVSERGGDGSLAIEYTRAVLDLEPFRETGWQQLMRLHAGMGNRAEAVRAFARCRKLLREELGVSPSPQTESVYLEILQERR